ncbi:hypothetical protein B0H13DRAFT_1883544 [Mycena leptocephala]|nr:hypothetical protein B0H13DRAFT_1883544 [Mycena leptocephala]
MLLAHLKANSTFTLAQARYGRDFVPTREATRGSASIYTFKSTRDYLNYDPVSETKNRSRKHLSTVFGAVGNVMDAGDGVHLVMQMKCPVDISCDAQAMYFKQIWRMKTIIEKDGQSTPGGVDLSWLDRTSRDGPSGHQKYGRYFVVIRANSASEFEAAKNLFWTSEIAGKIVRLVVSMERRDTIDCTTSVKSYTMFVTRYEVQADNCLPRIDADYRCDFAELNCRFCEKRRKELALCIEPPQDVDVGVQAVEGHSWGIFCPLRCICRTSDSKLTIRIGTRVRDSIEDERVARRVISKSLQEYQAQTLCVLDSLGNRITRIHIDAENDYVLRFVLDSISPYDSFDLRFLEIRVFNPLEPRPDQPVRTDHSVRVEIHSNSTRDTKLPAIDYGEVSATST